MPEKIKYCNVYTYNTPIIERMMALQRGPCLNPYTCERVTLHG